MLKDRQTQRLGRSLATINSYSSQAAGVRYSTLTSFSEDEHRESGFRYYIPQFICTTKLHKSCHYKLFLKLFNTNSKLST